MRKNSGTELLPGGQGGWGLKCDSKISREDGDKRLETMMEGKGKEGEEEKEE